MLRPMFAFCMTFSSSTSYVAWNSWGESCGDWYSLLPEASLSTPVIVMSPIGRPLWYVKINWFGLYQASLLTRAMKVSGTRMVYQLLLVTFFAKLRITNRNPPCSFPLGPREMALLVRVTWLLLGSSCSCTCQYCPILSPRWSLYWSVSPEIIVLGLRMVETPALTGKYFSILKTMKTIKMARILGILLKGRLCLTAIVISLTNIIRRSISGTCSFALVRLILGPHVRCSYIIARSGKNSKYA